MEKDEINLVDLWILVRRYKRHFISVFIFFIFVAFLYIYLIYTEAYSLTTTIQIGTREIDNIVVPIESPESLLSKINNSIIPSYTNSWTQLNDFTHTPQTSASNPNDTNIILIKNVASEENIDDLSDFQNGLVTIVKDDHKRVINSLKSRIQSESIMAQLKLDKLKNPLMLDRKLKLGQLKLDEEAIKLKKLEDDRYFGIKKAEFQNEILQEQHEQKRLEDIEEGYKKQLERIEESKKILLENIDDLKLQISDATKNRRIAAQSATEQSAMAQLLIGNEIQKNQNRLSTLEERYYVQLENEKTGLGQKIQAVHLQKIESKKRLELLDEKFKRMLVDNQFEREQQKLALDGAKIALEEIKLQHENSVSEASERVREIKTRLDNFDETRIVSVAVQSLKPTSLSRVQLLILSFVLAGSAGFVAMLFSVFADKVRERHKELAEKDFGAATEKSLG